MEGEDGGWNLPTHVLQQKEKVLLLFYWNLDYKCQRLNTFLLFSNKTFTDCVMFLPWALKSGLNIQLPYRPNI